MKLSKRIKNPLLSIETILYNGFRVAINSESDQVILSRKDTLRIIKWSQELREKELGVLALIEDSLQK
tara:strand:+ start:680 stop:883 length:204 start_codon:yes stop_codon:yes gene_type:complete